MLDIKKSFEGKTVVMEVSGQVTVATSKQLEAEFKRLFTAGEEDIVVDLAKCDYIASSGLRVLVSAQKHTSSSQAKMVFRNLSAEVAEVFDVTGLKEILSIED